MRLVVVASRLVGDHLSVPGTVDPVRRIDAEDLRVPVPDSDRGERRRAKLAESRLDLVSEAG